MRLESDIESDRFIQPNIQVMPSYQYTAHTLEHSHRADVTAMITSSFYEKADLEQWLMPDVYQEDYTDLVDKIWEPLIEKKLR